MFCDNQFFSHDRKEVIKEKNQIADGLGTPDWELSLWLLLAWTILYVVIIKGIQSSGKVSYFTAIFPYVILITLLIHASTLEGAVDGILYFITPNWDRLLEPSVWYRAVTQLFFSLTVGLGPISMFASYNKFRHNIYRDALIVTTLDTFTSLLAGFTIFGILGNLAHNLGETDLTKVLSSGGSGLAFVSYPDAIAKFESVPQVNSSSVGIFDI
jgi:solute carrier family 6 amino acid transporter-like protein 5/7/9/14